ncbi:MAG: Ig-like domain-containing protein, partial [Gemmatimonadota bacterium]|jgi:hypothetical protein
VTVTPAAASLFDAGTPGESQLFTATVLDLHSEPLPGVTVGWDVSDGGLVSLAPTSGTTDGSGQTSTTATTTGLVTDPTPVDVTATAQSSSGTAVLTVEPTPGRPLGQPDVFGVLQGSTLTIPAPGVLANDVDLEGDAISVSGVSEDVNNGTLTLQPDGSFTYTPELGFLGTDGFTYVAVDASANASIPVQVTLEVFEPSDLGPTATPDYYVVLEGNPLTVPAPGFLANDVDGNGQPISAVAVINSPDNGTLVAFPDGSFTYTPNPGFVGTDAFGYRMRDADLNADEATVTIEVLADPDKNPVAVDDQFVVVEGNALAIPAPGFLDNDLDPDGAAVSAVAVVNSPDNGTVVAFPDGSFTYTPDAGFVGTDAFGYRMRDADLNVDDATVTIDVLPASTVLPVATDDSYAVVEGNALQVVAAGFLLNDLDPDGQPISAVAVINSPDNGTLVAFPDGSFTYTPDAGFVGTDAFGYRMRDADLNTDDATVTIEVLADPDKNPVAGDDAYATIEGNALAVSAPGFLSNDLDPDGAAVTGVAVTNSPDNGTLVAFPDGSFTYTPNAGFVGTDAFGYRMRDADLNVDDATVTIEVLADPNQPPVPLEDFYATVAGVALNVPAPGFVGNDVDREGEAISATALVDSPDNGTVVAFPDGSFTYTPNPGFIGTDQWGYSLRDATFHTADGGVVTIEVLDPALAAASLVASAADDAALAAVGATGARPLTLATGRHPIPSARAEAMAVVGPEFRGDALPTGPTEPVAVPYAPHYRIDPAEFGAGKRPLPVVGGTRR